MKEPVPVAVLCSGGGTNLQALLDAAPGSAYRVAVVVADRYSAFALQRARAAQVPTEVVLLRDHPDRAAFDRAVVEVLAKHRPEWLALAGWMKLVGPPLLSRWPNRILNIHPSLLPEFPGLHAQRRAFEAGAPESGCTVHLVDGGLDTGPVLAQARVPRLPDDDAEALRLRILAAEHRLYPQVLDRVVRAAAG